MSGTEPHDPALENDPLRAFLSGKRRSERQECNLAVEMRGGGAVVRGTAIDLSEGGAMLRVEASAINAMKPHMTPLELLETLERYFKNGVQLVFLREGVRVPGTLVRLSPPTKHGEDIRIGCRFERELGTEESARLMRAPPAAPLVPLRLVPKSTEGLYVYLSTPEGALAGPLHLARATGLDGMTLDARIETSRPMSMEDVGLGLSHPGLFGRIVVNRKSVWGGPLHLQALRPALSMTPSVEGRFTTTVAFGRAVEKHFRQRS